MTPDSMTPSQIAELERLMSLTIGPAAQVRMIAREEARAAIAEERLFRKIKRARHLWTRFVDWAVGA